MDNYVNGIFKNEPWINKQYSCPSKETFTNLNPQDMIEIQGVIAQRNILLQKMKGWIIEIWSMATNKRDKQIIRSYEHIGKPNNKSINKIMKVCDIMQYGYVQNFKFIFYGAGGPNYNILINSKFIYTVSDAKFVYPITINENNEQVISLAGYYKKNNS